VQSHFQHADRVTEIQLQLQRLKQQNEQLAAELAAARSQVSVPGHAAADRLLLARCVQARVLGRQARSFLGRRQLLDVGSRTGIEAEALVLDYGHDAALEQGQLVLTGRRVWGKIVQLGPHTSVVRAVTEPGYRDLVQLGEPSGPQGILEGTGQPLARVRLVDVTEPIALGDPVYTATGKGVLPAPLLYGRVVRLERPIGAACWEIWMQPAVNHQPERVSVLRIELNPLRVVRKESTTKR